MRISGICRLIFLIPFLLGTLAFPIAASPTRDTPGRAEGWSASLDSPHAATSVFPSDHEPALYLGLGVEHLQAGRFQEAVEAFSEGEDLDNENARFPLYRGYALLRLGAVAAAEESLERALERDAENFDALRLLGHIRYETGRNRGAAELWRRALDIRAEDEEIGRLLTRAERDMEAEEGMVSSYGASFIVAYDGRAAPELGDRVLDVLEEAFLDVGSFLLAYPETQVPVVLYTQKKFSAVTASPDWAGGLYDGKIRLPIGGVESLAPAVRALIYHEYTHVLVRHLSRDNSPRWLNEGLAEWMARRQHNPPLHRFRQAENSGELFSWQGLDSSWAGLSGSRVRLAYEQSFLIVRYLVRQFGWVGMSDLLQALGEGMTVEGAFEQAYGGYGKTLQALEREWGASLDG